MLIPFSPGTATVLCHPANERAMREACAFDYTLVTNRDCPIDRDFTMTNAVWVEHAGMAMVDKIAAFDRLVASHNVGRLRSIGSEGTPDDETQHLI